MTGVGGIFPNYEDHLLDKKKISECFSGNFHEILYPLNYTSKQGPWQYHSPQDDKHFIDLNTLTWNGKIRVTNKKDPNSPVITANQTKDNSCMCQNTETAIPPKSNGGRLPYYFYGPVTATAQIRTPDISSC